MTGAAEPPRLDAYRLLAIDDDLDSADLVVRIAKKCGYVAEVLLRHDELPAQLKAAPIDVLTLDLCMPDQDGIRTMAVLQENAFKGAIVIISGQDDWLRKSASRLAEARGLVIAGDFAKPLDIVAMTKFLNALQAERPAKVA
jgi:two-component system chemotaxis response regulator CheY